jgi:hypothetical protein
MEKKTVYKMEAEKSKKEERKRKGRIDAATKGTKTPQPSPPPSYITPIHMG